MIRVTATTESYTYRHSVSLHDALPILIRAAGDSAQRFLATMRAVQAGPRCVSGAMCGRRQRLLTASGRSEEATSELQSLMRISYAVFCLKKKKRSPPAQRTPWCGQSSQTRVTDTAF